MFSRNKKPVPKTSIPETRINKEIQELKECETSGVSAAPITPEDTTHWKGHIKGPDGTSYEGGLFVVDIVLPSSYPFEPPKMKFETKVWHPNISSQTGAICLDILKDQWSPALTIRTALQSLQALLSSPVPDDPQDAVVAQMYKTNIAMFEATARDWTKRHATEHSADEGVAALVEMGFSADAARRALISCGGDQQRALETLLGES